MHSSQNGTSISEYSVTEINDFGFWVFAGEKEYFVPFSEYAGFKNATVNQIQNFSYIKPLQLHWEDLDIDIELPALSHPESFPLVFR